MENPEYNEMENKNFQLLKELNESNKYNDKLYLQCTHLLDLLDKSNKIDEHTSIRGYNKEYVFYNSMEATKET